MIHDEILDFIHRRFTSDCNWLNGNCYYFAQILCTRFPELEIYYLPVEGHFVSGNGNEYFDWTGKVDISEEPIKLSKIQEMDSKWYSHIVRDCVL